MLCGAGNSGTAWISTNLLSSVLGGLAAHLRSEDKSALIRGTVERSITAWL